ncbi:MAG: type IIA DNA topoisomerase subunit B [Candidatus Aminicenantes bacterium]|nr:MAG: type IIA DNA topoisomerase subunit B [Candidatus Aminicenantes bacterium]
MTDIIEKYTEETIKTLEWREHIRKRPGMYIGKLGDGSAQDDGIYVLVKEVIDNAVDEYMMGFGKKIDIAIADQKVRVRDYGRGVPLGKVVDVASKMNTGAKYDSKVFKKCVGLNGVGIKAVNALSSNFIIRAFRDGKMKAAEFTRGHITRNPAIKKTDQPTGTEIIFEPDQEMFGNFHFFSEYVEHQVQNYVYLNSGLAIYFNGHRYYSRNGLKDLLEANMSEPGLYPIIHLKGEDIEIAMTHGTHYSEEYYSFVNGQYTTQGGTHLQAFREGVVKTIREFYKKDFDISDIRTSIIAAVSVKIEEPVFDSQTKTKLGSKDMGPDGPSVRNFVLDFIKTSLDNYLHKNQDIAEGLLKKILESEKERKAMSGIKKLARDRAKKVSLHNKKLRDCRIHFNTNHERRMESTLFITEGDSASGSVTKARDVETQAVFSLKGKPLNTHGLTRKVVYQNEEFNLLQAALNIEDSIDDLRYNNIVIATDADVDGMHIRLLMITFFLNFFPEIIKKRHLHILQTPLFRVRNKKQTFYCYTEQERQNAITACGKNAEITRFKGLGEISPDEFKHFIGKDIRLEPVVMRRQDAVPDMLDFYMGKNTPQRQEFIIDHLKVEEDRIDELEKEVENVITNERDAA